MRSACGKAINNDVAVKGLTALQSKQQKNFAAGIIPCLRFIGIAITVTTVDKISSIRLRFERKGNTYTCRLGLSGKFLLIIRPKLFILHYYLLT